jgi:hypothetical protein
MALTATVTVTSSARADEKSPDAPKNLARADGGAQIECTTPEGRVLQLPAAGEEKRDTPLLTMNEDTVTCPLAEGETTFVIKLPGSAALDRLTFENEKAAAAGQLRISVSNFHLPAGSPDWVQVEGSIAFTKKRLFNLSMVGVEARYVKLTFKVEKAGRIASLGLYGGETLTRLAWR